MITGIAENIAKPVTTAPLLEGEIELKSYSIQGNTFKQRKPCFDFQLKIIQKKFDLRYDAFVKKQMKSSVSDLTDDKQLAEVFKHLRIKDIYEYLSMTDTILNLEAKVKEAQVNQDIFMMNELKPKLDAFNAMLDRVQDLRAKRPELYSKFQEFLNNMISDSVTTHELFILDCNNIYALMEIWLEGKIDIVENSFNDESKRIFKISIDGKTIDLNPFDSQENSDELEQVCLTMLYDYKLLKKK